VVIADDESVVCMDLREMLTNLGYLVVGEAGDGHQAVELALRTRPDVVLMDVTMPNMNGIEATQRILEARPATRVIGLSMHEEEDMAIAMTRAGAVGYLPKGTSASVLIASILAQAK